MEQENQGTGTMSAAEREALGTDHAQVGAAMAEAWFLPSRLVQSIGSHHDDDDGNESVGPLVE